MKSDCDTFCLHSIGEVFFHVQTQIEKCFGLCCGV